MVRAQIQLPEEQYRKLRKLAQRLGISVAEAVRRCVATELERLEDAPSRDTLIREALAVCGRHVDPQGSSRVAEEHDRHLAEAYRG